MVNYMCETTKRESSTIRECAIGAVFALLAATVIMLSLLAFQPSSHNGEDVVTGGDFTRVDPSTTTEIPRSFNSDDGVSLETILDEKIEDISGTRESITRLVSTSLSDITIQNLDDLDLVVNQFEDPEVINWLIQVASARMVAKIGHQEAFKQTQSYSDSRGLRALFAVVENWAISNPAIALEMVSSVTNADIRLRLQQTIVSTWAQEDPRVFLESQPNIPPMLRGLATQMALYTLAMTNPEEAATYLERYRGTVVESEYVTVIATHWAQLNSPEALNWASTQDVFSRDAIALEAISIILRMMAESNPEVAFDHALRISKQQGWTLLPRTVMWIIAETDINLALDCLSKITDRYMKREAAIPVGISLINRQQFDEALELAKNVDASLNYFEWIFDHWAMTQPFSLLNRLDQLPHNNRAALSLRYAHYTLRCFDLVDLQHLVEYLHDDEKREMTTTLDNQPDQFLDMSGEFQFLRVQDSWGAMHRHYLNSIPQLLSVTGQLPKTIQRQ